MEERGLKISRQNTESLGVMTIRRRYKFTGRGIKESEYIHLPGIDVGGRW